MQWLGLCSLSPIVVLVEQIKTAQSHSFVEESFHMIENWSCAVLPQSSRALTWCVLGWWYCIQLSRVDIQFALPVHWRVTQTCLPNRTRDIQEHQTWAWDTNQAGTHRKPFTDFCLPPERQSAVDGLCPTCLKIDRFAQRCLQTWRDQTPRIVRILSNVWEKRQEQERVLCGVHKQCTVPWALPVETHHQILQTVCWPCHSIVTRMTKVHMGLRNYLAQIGIFILLCLINCGHLHIFWRSNTNSDSRSEELARQLPDKVSQSLTQVSLAPSIAQDSWSRLLRHNLLTDKLGKQFAVSW